MNTWSWSVGIFTIFVEEFSHQPKTAFVILSTGHVEPWRVRDCVSSQVYQLTQPGPLERTQFLRHTLNTTPGRKTSGRAS